jgi:hypothetical protein
MKNKLHLKPAVINNFVRFVAAVGKDFYVQYNLSSIYVASAVCN